MLRCGCTSICLADRANKSTTTPGNWSKVAAHGVRGLSKKSREETLLTGEFPDSLHSMALQTAVSRQSGNGNCPSAISTQPRLCCGCTSVYPKKPYWGWVSDTQTSQWFDVCWCFKPTKPIPSAPAKKTNSKPQRSDPGWSTALSLQHQVHTHIKAAQDSKNSHVLLGFLHKGACWSNTSSFICGSGRVLLKKTAKKHPLQGSTQHAPSEADPVADTRQEVGTFRTTSNFHFFTLEQNLFRLSP